MKRLRLKIGKLVSCEINRKNYFFRLFTFFWVLQIFVNNFLPVYVLWLKRPVFVREIKEIAQEVVNPPQAKATYQFNPIAGNLAVGVTVAISSATAASANNPGSNVGSWKGTLADDNFQWVIQNNTGVGTTGFDMQIDVGRVQLNGANSLIVETEAFMQNVAVAPLVQICDWHSSSSVDRVEDANCNDGDVDSDGAGWRTLNNRDVGLATTNGTAYHWRIYNGYWSNGSDTPIDTPLTNFVDSSNKIRIRYFTSYAANTYNFGVDYLRVYAMVYPIYTASGFQNLAGGAVTGDYTYTTVVTQGASDNTYLQVAGTGSTAPEFYLKFGNVKTYQGMNTIMVRTEVGCSAATNNLNYVFKIKNHTTGDWETIADGLDCSAAGTDITDMFAKNSISNMDDYLGGDNNDEIWIGDFGSINSTTSLRIDMIYLILGSVNTDTDECEVTFGTTTGGRIANNPSGPGADQITAMDIDNDYMYLAGYDSEGIDNEWRIEKRNLSDGELVTDFNDTGIAATDPGATTADQAKAIVVDDTYLYAAGYDRAGANDQWRIEKRNKTTGLYDTGFGSAGIATTNPSAQNAEIIYGLASDNDNIYAVGADYIPSATNSQWRIEKRKKNDGTYVLGFASNGVGLTNPTATLDIPYAASVAVGSSALIVGGYQATNGNDWLINSYHTGTGALNWSVNGNPYGGSGSDILYALDTDDTYLYAVGLGSSGGGSWRIEKRQLSDGALCNGGGNCGGDTFGTSGAITSDFLTSVDAALAVDVDGSFIYIAGYVYSDSTYTNEWRIEKRNIGDGSLVNTFSDNGAAISVDGADDKAQAIKANDSNLYIAGYGNGPGDNQWLIEKRDKTSGLRVSSGFNVGGCAGTRDIDTTSGERSAWAIRAEDESTNMTHDFYALDQDGNATIGEAVSANIGIGISVPSAAAVTSIVWAMKATAGLYTGNNSYNQRLAIKDFSGLSGTTGGRTLIGSNIRGYPSYFDPIVAASISAAGGYAGFQNNPEDYIDTSNNQMRINLVTTVDGLTYNNQVSVWDFAMLSIAWIEDASHPSKTYQFVPVSGNLAVGLTQPITSGTAAAVASPGSNIGSWKGTLGDDNFQWVVTNNTGVGTTGLDVQLTVGGIPTDLNGANTFMIQTEVFLENTAFTIYPQICDWVSSTSVDKQADANCTTGGWRTLTNRDTALPTASGTAYHFQIYNGYFSDGANGTVDTPLANFVNNNQITIRYFSNYAANTYKMGIDYLRVYAMVFPIYAPGGFVNNAGGAVTGDYTNTTVVTQGASDNVWLSVAGTGSTAPDFTLKFKNVKTYQGMNTILVREEGACSAATSDLRYHFAIRNFTSGEWEDVSDYLDCSYSATVDYINMFAKNNISNIDDYTGGDANDEIWIRTYGSINSTTALRLDQIYLILGSTNTDADECEITLGTATAGRIAENPSRPYADQITAMKIDDTYMYLAGYDSEGIDNEWRIEKRNLSDGVLVTDFNSTGIATTDPGATTADQAKAVVVDDTYLYVGGYDRAGANDQWRIEKRDKTTGLYDTGFGSAGIATTNPSAQNAEIIYGLASDNDNLYAVGADYTPSSSNSQWRIEKRRKTNGSYVTDFASSGVGLTNPTTTIDVPYAASVAVGSSALIVGGVQATNGNDWLINSYHTGTSALNWTVNENPYGGSGSDIVYALDTDSTYLYAVGLGSSGGGSIRIEKRNLSDGQLVGAFGTGGAITSDVTNNQVDVGLAIDVDASYIYIAGYQYVSSGNTAWRMEKRDITTGALVNAFSEDGVGISEDGTTDAAQAIAVNTANVFIAGYGNGPGDNQWLIEKRDQTNGFRVTSGFGTGSCASTRNIDTTGDRNAWSIQTENDSTNLGHEFYALDNQGNAVLEEAVAANIGIGISVPSGAAITSIVWAGRANAGFGGGTFTERFSIKDYSGLTGITGGRTLIGGNVSNIPYYTDPIVQTGVAAAGGYSGYLNNPEDYVDTLNNQMRMNLNTTDDGLATNNSTTVLDFAMLSIAWIEVSGAAANSPTNDSLTFTNPNSANIAIADNLTEWNFQAVVSDADGYTNLDNVKLRLADSSDNSDPYEDLEFTWTESTGLFTETGADALSTASLGVGSTSYSVNSCTINFKVVFNSNFDAKNTDYNAQLLATDDTSRTDSDSYTDFYQVRTNQNPNSPSNLTQMKTDNTGIVLSGWINATSVKVGATASDLDSSDTLYLCVERDLLAVSFSDIEDSCGIGVTYSGTPITLTETVSGLSDDSEYHWQVRVKDAGGSYSSWEAFGGGVTRDFGTDTSVPTGGTVYDGSSLGVDQNFNGGSLSQLSAKWSGINGDVSGIASYQYSIGSTAGTTDVKVWTSVGTGTSATATGLSLQTSQLYFFNIRATDNAGNTQSPVISSNGQQVAPSLNFSVSPAAITFASLGVGNSYSDTQDTTLTTSTNAYGGYVVRTYTTDILTSAAYPSFSIPNFDGGTYVSPGTWGPGNVGFGYTSFDETIQGEDKFVGGTLYAPFSQTGPGDIVADHTGNVSGAPIIDEQFAITYKVKTSNTQQASPYSTTVVYTITAQY